MGRTLKILLPIFVLAVLSGVVVLLHHELRQYDYAAVSANLRDVPREKILLALVLMVASYALLVCYDALALRQVGRSPGLLRTAFVSFTAYVLSYNIGIAVISGTAVRFRLYSAWGYTTQEIGQIVAFTSATFWIGLFTAAGLLLASGQAASVADSPLGSHLRLVGCVLLAVAAAYVLLCFVRHRPVAVRGWILPLPGGFRALGQIALGATDVIVAGLVAWVLMPEGWPLENFLAVYLLGMTAGLLSHVPGGLGVLETILLYGRPDSISGPAVLGSILVFRVVYYLLPLVAAVSLFTGHELHRNRQRLQRATEAAGRWAPRIAPQLFAAMVFVAGVILLMSSATPAVHGRLALVRHLLPLPVLELSHLLSSVVGLLLLFVARGLQRRLDAAYLLSIILLCAGAVFSILKGVDWEEACALVVVLGLVLPAHGYFTRRASLFEARFTPGWIVAILVVIAGQIWLGFFAYRHVEYRNELWWHFAFRGDAPRFLRGSVAVVAVATAIGIRRLLRPAAQRPPLPSADELDRAAAVAAASRDSTAHLALVGDKALLFSPSGRSFIMYGVEGRSWIAMGDPQGDETEFEELAWSFRELTDQNGAWTAFYEVGTEHLPLYLDLGLTLTKLGEEAKVPLDGFDLESLESKSVRRGVKQVEETGAEFAWIPLEEVPALLPQLHVVSDAWLASRTGAEKGFSLGYFDAAYLRRNPLAVVRQAGKIVAFANIWSAAGRSELSVDLMRFSSDAPPRVMDFLLTRIMARAATDGYAWFNLGMAPLSGMEAHALAPLPHRIAARVFEHGERFYHFQGLRSFKEKFSPVWSPRYLASPGRLALPVVLANATRLIGRGAPKPLPA